MEIHFLKNESRLVKKAYLTTFGNGAFIHLL